MNNSPISETPLNRFATKALRGLVALAVIALLAAAGVSYLDTLREMRSSQQSYALTDLSLQMDRLDRAIRQIGAGQIADASQTLDTQIALTAGRIYAQLEAADAAAQSFALLTCSRAAEPRHFSLKAGSALFENK